MAFGGTLTWLIEPPAVRGLSRDQAEGLELIKDELQRRLDELGENGSGLFGYYTGKLLGDAIVSDLEVGALEFFRANRGRWRRVWEIGAGVGQLGALLAVDGFDVISLDHDGARFAALSAVAARLRPLIAAGHGRLEPRCASFPAAADGQDVSNDIAVAFGCAWTESQAFYDSFWRRLIQFDAALVEFGTLFTATDLPSEETARAEQHAERSGIAKPAVIYRYENPGRPGVWAVHLVEARPASGNAVG